MSLASILENPSENLLGNALSPKVSKLSFGQEQLWALEQLTPGTATYNLPLAIRINGSLSTQRLERSLLEVVQRHEVFRTVFVTIGGQPFQVIRNAPVTLSKVEACGETLKARLDWALHFCEVDCRRPFEVEQGVLSRFTLVKVSVDEFVFLMTVHHAIFDGWSVHVFLRELMAVYNSLSAEEPPHLQGLPIQYSDFVHWQRRRLQGNVLENLFRYWQQCLAGAPSTSRLLPDHSCQDLRSYGGHRQPLEFTAGLTANLKSLSKNEGVTLFITLAAAVCALLHRHTGQDEIVIGFATAGRDRPETHELIGFFVNTLPLRVDCSGEPTFRELMGGVGRMVREAYAHQDLPLQKIVSELNSQRAPNTSPLFQVMLVLQNNPAIIQDVPGLTFDLLDIHTGTAKFELTIELREEANRLTGWFEYDVDLFGVDTMERLAEHFQLLLEGVTRCPDARICSVPLMTDAETRKVVLDWNQTASDYPNTASVPSLFEAQVLRAPQAVAVVQASTRLTYEDLNQRANQLAGYLLEIGVPIEARVGLLFERSLDAVVALLATLKVGAAYVPLDLSSPPERLAWIVQHSQCDVVLMHSHLASKLPPTEARTVCIDRQRLEIARLSLANPKVVIHSANLAYLMYTSGSTGTPKGVAVTHQNIIRLVCGNTYASFSADETFLQLAPIAFDASTFEIWGSLLNGARLVLFPDELPSPQQLTAVIQENGITTIWLTAGLFHQIVDCSLEGLQPLRQLLTGGDVLWPTPVRAIIRALPACKLINGYGPTEATTFACCHPVEDSDDWCERVPIGRPIANARAYVLDRHIMPVPIGVPGELHIGGAGLARGYFDRPDLTAARFIPDPFGPAGSRIYRTGDRVRWRHDGTLDFLGRLDRQVKIRGYRVELAEVEAVLLSHPLVRQALALEHEYQPGDKHLVAYIATSSPVIVSELRSFVRLTLPEYMVPVDYFTIDALPLTSNGKVDRSRLQGAERIPKSSADEALRLPSTPTETWLADLWCQLLGRPVVSANDEFFDIGGNSLLVVRLGARIEQKVGQTVPLGLIVQNPTLEQMAEALDHHLHGSNGISRGPLQPFFCLDWRAPRLARYLWDRPVYRIDIPWQELGTDLRIEAMAKYAVAKILSIQTSPPYLLGGWSGMGIVAFEVAQQLYAQGLEVSLLALFDPTPLPRKRSGRVVKVDFPSRKMRYFARRALYHWKKSDISRVIRDFLALRIPRHVSASPGNEETVLLLRAILNNFTPRCYPGNVGYFIPKDSIADYTQAPYLAWGDLIRGRFAVHRIPGDHQAMWDEPNIQVLIENLNKCIESTHAE